MKQTNNECKTVAQQISTIRDYLVLGAISQDHFGRSNAWLSRRVKSVRFNTEAMLFFRKSS